MLKKLIWKNEEQFGCEHFSLRKEDTRFLAKGTIIYVEEDKTDAHIVEYQVNLDLNWITKELKIVIDGHDSLDLRSDCKGCWYDINGNEMDRLAGAIDIDISATPFSNSLPINRIEWSPDQECHFEMVYISIPSLEVKKVPQSYKYISNEDNKKFFNYRCYDYETTICVDGDGTVISYPNVFSRVL